MGLLVNQLVEEQYHLCKQYLNLLTGIDEGFTYVIASFTDYSKTEGDRVLSDILFSFYTIGQTNTILCQLVENDETLKLAISDFTKVLHASFQLEGDFIDNSWRMHVINNSLHPIFTSWRETIQSLLFRYVEQ